MELPILDVFLSESKTFDMYCQENRSFHINDSDSTFESSRWNEYKQKKNSKNLKKINTSSQTRVNFMIDKSTMKWTLGHKHKNISCSPKEIYYDLNYKDPKIKKYFSGALEDIYDVKLGREIFYGDYKSKKTKIKGIPSQSLIQGLRLVETVLSSRENMYSLRLYGRPLIFQARAETNEEEPMMRIQRLFQITQPKVEKRISNRINCFFLHKSDKWLVVVGCGEISLSKKSKGFVYCWNIKNLYQPDFKIQTPSAVTALSCCPEAPQVLAVALLNGCVQAYAFTSSSCNQLFDTQANPDLGCHTGPIWQLGWRPPKVVKVKSLKQLSGELSSLKEFLMPLKKRGRDSIQVQIGLSLISISEDGTLREWLFSKETGIITSNVLINIVTTSPYTCLNNSSFKSHEKYESGFSLLLTRSSGLCFSFLPAKDSNKFIIGTQFGEVSLWHTIRSTSPTVCYEGHSMAVTSVDWKPTSVEAQSDTFLSSSLDGTIKIWHVEKSSPNRIITFPGKNTNGYLEASWCPWLTDLLIGIHEGGIHFWDISSMSQSPLHSWSHERVTSAKFSLYSRVLAVSDESGQVAFYRLSGFGDGSVLFMKLTSAVKKLVKMDPFH